MTLTRGRPRGISAKRLERIEKDIAPLVARGLTHYEIADKLGISKSQVALDCRLVTTNWDDQVSTRLEIARGELVAKHDHLYKTCMEAFSVVPQPKWIELASKELECLGRLLGQAGPSINLHAHQHNVAITTEAVGDLFKPLDAGSYAEMVASKALPPTEATELPDVAIEAESAGTDQWVAGDPVPVEVVDPSVQPKAKKAARPYPFRT